VLGKRQGTQREFDRMRRSTCTNCPCGCGVKVFLRDGAIVDIVGDEDHPVNKGSLCPKGLLSYHHQRNPGRVVQPLIRRDRREPFRRASWREAVGFAAQRLGEIEKVAGREGCYVHCNPSASFGYRLGATLFAREYGTPHGPWCFQPPALGPDGAIAKMFGVPGSRLLTNTPRDWSHSQCIVIYGCDPAATDPMTIGPVIDARDRGVEVIVIDNLTTVTATKASYALRVRPGSEAIAMRGILRLLFDNGWVDEEFVREATNGTELLRAELLDFSVERVARTCGVPAAELRRVAQVIGTSKPVQVLSGGWLASERFGDDDLRLCGALAALRGSIGIPGGGLNLLNASPFDCVEWLGPRAPHAGKEPLSLEGVLLGRSDAIGALIVEGDPCARLPGGAQTRQALARVPMVAVLSAYENATTAHADVVLPMASWLEAAGLIANGNGRALQWQHRVTPPPGECRSPLQFWTDLAAACGFGERLPWSGDPVESWDRAAADWALRQNPWTRAATVELLDPERNPPGGILWPCSEIAQIAFEESRFTRGDVRGSPNVLFQRNRAFPLGATRFPTSDGRLTVAAANRGMFEEPDAGALRLVPAVPVDHVEHYSGMTLGRAPGPARPVLSLHPRTAMRFKLKEGDLATVENALGALTGVVSVTETVAENTIGCAALPARTSDRADVAHDSAWSLRAVSLHRLSRISYAAVTIRAT
jgi:anaerobic selenocysteine-containing dehydrogenase